MIAWRLHSLFTSHLFFSNVLFHGQIPLALPLPPSIVPFPCSLAVPGPFYSSFGFFVSVRASRTPSFLPPSSALHCSFPAYEPASILHRPPVSAAPSLAGPVSCFFRLFLSSVVSPQSPSSFSVISLSFASFVSLPLFSLFFVSSLHTLVSPLLTLSLVDHHEIERREIVWAVYLFYFLCCPFFVLRFALFGSPFSFFVFLFLSFARHLYFGFLFIPYCATSTSIFLGFVFFSHPAFSIGPYDHSADHVVIACTRTTPRKEKHARATTQTLAPNQSNFLITTLYYARSIVQPQLSSLPTPKRPLPTR